MENIIIQIRRNINTNLFQQGNKIWTDNATIEYTEQPQNCYVMKELIEQIRIDNQGQISLVNEQKLVNRGTYVINLIRLKEDRNTQQKKQAVILFFKIYMRTMYNMKEQNGNVVYLDQFIFKYLIDIGKKHSNRLIKGMTNQFTKIKELPLCDICYDEIQYDQYYELEACGHYACGKCVKNIQKKECHICRTAYEKFNKSNMYNQMYFQKQKIQTEVCSLCLNDPNSGNCNQEFKQGKFDFVSKLLNCIFGNENYKYLQLKYFRDLANINQTNPIAPIQYDDLLQSQLEKYPKLLYKQLRRFQNTDYLQCKLLKYIYKESCLEYGTGMEYLCLIQNSDISRVFLCFILYLNKVSLKQHNKILNPVEILFIYNMYITNFNSAGARIKGIKEQMDKYIIDNMKICEGLLKNKQTMIDLLIGSKIEYDIKKQQKKQQILLKKQQIQQIQQTIEETKEETIQETKEETKEETKGETKQQISQEIPQEIMWNKCAPKKKKILQYDSEQEEEKIQPVISDSDEEYKQQIRPKLQKIQIQKAIKKRVLDSDSDSESDEIIKKPIQNTQDPLIVYKIQKKDCKEQQQETDSIKDMTNPYLLISDRVDKLKRYQLEREQLENNLTDEEIQQLITQNIQLKNFKKKKIPQDIQQCKFFIKKKDNGTGFRFILYKISNEMKIYDDFYCYILNNIIQQQNKKQDRIHNSFFQRFQFTEYKPLGVIMFDMQNAYQNTKPVHIGRVLKEFLNEQNYIDKTYIQQIITDIMKLLNSFYIQYKQDTYKINYLPLGLNISRIIYQMITFQICRNIYYKITIENKIVQLTNKIIVNDQFKNPVQQMKELVKDQRFHQLDNYRDIERSIRQLSTQTDNIDQQQKMEKLKKAKKEIDNYNFEELQNDVFREEDQNISIFYFVDDYHIYYNINTQINTKELIKFIDNNPYGQKINMSKLIDSQINNDKESFYILDQQQYSIEQLAKITKAGNKDSDKQNWDKIISTGNVFIKYQ